MGVSTRSTWGVSRRSLHWVHLCNMAMLRNIIMLLMVVATLLTLAECMSIGDTEIVRSSYGFYGLPNYRPYGFTYGGYGSAGYGYLRTYIRSPNIYGGYYYQ